MTSSSFRNRKQLIMDKLLKKMDSLQPEERKRLRTLLEEKSDKKTEVQWMYKRDKPGTEEYLLGRRIDKHIEEPKESEETDKDAPGALFEEVIARRTDLDMHTKMREDPLYAIRRKEEEARKKLLQNPIKMKHLQKMIEEKEKHKANKKRKEKKKHKKHKKHKHRSSSNSSDSDDSLVRQYLEVVKKKQKMCADACSRSEDECEEAKKRPYGLIVAATQEAVPKRQETSPYQRESESVREERHKKHGREASGSRTLSPHNKSRSYRRSRSRERQVSRHRQSEPKREDRKRKLDSDAMERKRQAMLENAKWRDEQRRENIKKYKEEADKEKTLSTKHKHGADFLNPLLMEHAAQSSVADRIKRNIYSIQRTTADLDKNFTKH